MGRRYTFEQLGEHRRQLLALVSVGLFMVPFDSSLVFVGLPEVRSAVGMSVSASLWVQAAYLLTTAVLLIPFGRLADHYGRMRFFLVGTIVFTLGSVLAALSVSGTMLICSRMIQGAGGALQVATAAAMVTAVFPRQERGRALGITTMAVYLGLSIGPVVGGQVVDHSWRALFLINVPIGLVVAVWAWVLLPARERGERRRLRLDVSGAVLQGIGLLCLLVPVLFAAEWGWGSPVTVTLLAISVLGFAGFVLNESRAADPLLRLDLLRHNRLFAMGNTAVLFNYMALFGTLVLTPIYLEDVQGRPASQTGWIMFIQPVLQTIMSPLSGRLSDRVGSRLLTTSGMTAMAAGMFLLAFLPAQGGAAQAVAAFAIIGLGVGAFSAPNISAIMGSVGQDELSIANSFYNTMRVTGNALSVALLGAIAVSQLGPGGADFPSGAGGAVAAAYATGYRYAMLTAAALALLGAVASMTRGRRQASGAEPAAMAAAAEQQRAI
jgi:EmrB/QacA subfamily drug resistance transporter